MSGAKESRGAAEDAAAATAPGDRGLYKMRTISRLTGFSPALLRAWERRHALLVPARGAGGHRLYTPNDLAVLRRVRRLLDEGRSIGEVAVRGRDALLEGAEHHEPGPLPPSRAPTPAPAFPSEDAPAHGGPPSGGLAHLRDELVRAAIAIDGRSFARVLEEAFAQVSTETAIEVVVHPAAVEIGRLWAQGRCSIAGEHLASSLILQRLQRIIAAVRNDSASAPAVITCCAPQEHHEVGALIVAYHLSRAGARISHLGANLPLEDLERACAVVRPRAAFVSVAREETLAACHRDLCALARRLGPSVRLVVGGMGIHADRGELGAAGALAWPVTRPLADLGSLVAEEPRPAPDAPPTNRSPAR